ncbi:MAG: hypothetical protein KDA66_18035, partial [Planctomycetaceae bacterium]|nr:hypothetical protein [Planctomycetaceae bacterium]
MLTRIWFTLVVVAAITTPCAAADPISIRVAFWNMESDFRAGQKDSDPEFLKGQLAEKNGVCLWGLCEVLNASTLKTFEEGIEDGENTDFISVMGTTGGRDRLAVVYDSALFEQVGHPIELTSQTQLTNGLRASLVVHLKGRRSGQEFLFVVNHLKRGGAQNRTRLKQAKNLASWARNQTLPIICLGDMNMDYDVTPRSGGGVLGDNGVPSRDAGFDALTQGGVFTWVRPENMVKSQADDRYPSLLDFIFVANAPFGWSGTSHVLDREGDSYATTFDFDDDSNSTDHRPVDAIFVLDQGAAPSNVAAASSTWPEMPNDLHWVRNSAEYRSLAFQTYALAEMQLQTMKDSGNLPASGTWAVALDADETILDNSLYQLEERGKYDRQTWKAWCLRKEASSVPGAKEFLTQVRKKKKKIGSQQK